MGMRRGVLTLCGLLIAASVASPVWAKGWLRDVDHALSVARAAAASHRVVCFDGRLPSL